jgi:FtsP/CotA-like multicopper oxidase with cupredoxin domain
MKVEDLQARSRRAAAKKGLSRRTFLGWSTWAVGAVPGGAALSLVACGGSGDSPATSPAAATPSPDPVVIESPASVSISIQARQVQWVEGKTPMQANAWVYVADGTPATGVLGNQLGPFLNVRRNSPCAVTWANTIPNSTLVAARLADPPINVPLDLGMCGRVVNQSPVGLSTHLHGARVQADSDGWPLTPISFAGNPYGFPQSRQDAYPNAQRGAMLWYHDHGMDRVGRHVHAGLAGPYCIRDAADDAILALIGGRSQELLFVISDRILSSDQTSIDYDAGIPHDYSLSNVGSDDAVGRPEFLGKQIFINGHPAPDLSLARTAVRLRVLNLSNARTYGLALCDPDAIAAGSGRVWYSQCLRLIGADGGLIGASVQMQDTDALVIAPAQRRDIMIDLSAVPASVTRLRLVNLSLRYLLAVDALTLEAIYTTFDNSILAPTNAQFDTADQTLYGALDGPLAILATIELEATAGTTLPAPTAAAIDNVLASAADEDDFAWDGTQMGRAPGVTLGANRLVLLVSNTERLEVGTAVNGISGWSDVQIFEMQAGGADWFVPFAVDLATTSEPAAGDPSPSAQGYGLNRRSFFAQEVNPDITLAKVYPPLHAPTISAKAGTYERWYVANINNSQPLDAAAGAPDMHPFHIHLVNFIALRRWELDDSGSFVPVPPSDLLVDRIGRQDTVAISSNQIVELLVHYPLGYSGDFAYHCHILEHEDNCMMSHYHVDA